MKQSRFIAEQIVAILREAEGKDGKVREIGRQHGVAETTFYRWRKAYGGLQVSESPAAQGPRGGEPPAQAPRGRPGARHRDAERRGGAKVVTADQRRRAVTHLRAAFAVSARRACRLLGLSRSRWHYRPRRPLRDAPVRARLKELASARPRVGYKRLHVLLRREGQLVNLKRLPALPRRAPQRPPAAPPSEVEPGGDRLRAFVLRSSPDRHALLRAVAAEPREPPAWRGGRGSARERGRIGR